MILKLNYIKEHIDENKKLHYKKSLVQCDNCGKKRVVSTSNLNLEKNITLCSSCCKISIKENNYQKLANSKNLIIQDKNIPTNSGTNINWKCNKCDYIWNISFANLKRSNVTNCPKCESHAKITKHEYIKLANQFNLIFLGPIPKATNIKTNWICSCKRYIRKTYWEIKTRPKCYNCWLEKVTKPKEFHHKRKDHSGSLYRNWTIKIFEKYNFTCQKCKIRGKNLNAHHIFTWKEHPNLRFNIENGICLCEKCHSQKYKNSFHHKYGTKNNNLKQIEEFINRPLIEINQTELLINIK